MAATSQELALIVRAKNKARSELRGVGKDLDNLDKKTGKLGKSFAQFGKIGKAAALGAGAALAAFTVKGIADFVNFDDKMTQSLAIMGDSAQKWRGEMETAAREVGKTTTFSASQAAEAYFFLASAGFDAQQSIAAMPQVASFAQAGMFDLARATDLATDAQSALGMTSDDAAENLKGMTRVTDVLVKANTLANASVEQFATSLTNKAGAALKVVGKDIEEGVAVLAAFADQGIKGAEAGTAMNIVMREMQTKALKNKDAFEEMNIAVFDSAGEMRNIGDIIKDTEDALEGMSDEQKKATLANLGYSDKSVIFIQTLLGQGDAIKEYEEKLRSAGGMTQEVADKQLESAKNQFKLLLSQVEDVGIELGGTLTPLLLDFASNVLPGVVDWLKNFTKGIEVVIEWFQSIPGPVQKAILIIGGLVIALSTLYAHPVIFGLAVLAMAIAQIGGDALKAEKAVDGLAGSTEQLGKKQGLAKWLQGRITDVKGFAENMEELDITYTDVLTALEGGESTWQTLMDQVQQNASWGDRLTGSYSQLERELDRTKHAYDEVNYVLPELNANLAAQELRLKDADAATRGFDSAQEEMKEQALAASAELMRQREVTDELSEGLEAAEEETRSLISAMLELADPVFGAIESMQGLEDMLERIDEDGERTNDELFELAQKTLEVGAKFDGLSSENIEAAIDGVARSLGISTQKARDLLVEMGLLDGKNVAASITVDISTIGEKLGFAPSGPGSIGYLLRAKGGPVTAGQSYFVGEDGVELFTPEEDGYIHPAGSFGTSSNGGAAGIGGDEIHLHLHDVDLTEGSRRTLERIREGIRELDLETL